MFDWFFDFLYSITKGLLSLIDGVLAVSNKLCGIESINVDGEEIDFLTYLIRSNEVQLAFRTAAILGLVVIVFFSIFQMIRNLVKEKSEETPTQVGIKAAKSVLMFLFVPTCMFALIWIVNVFMVAIYSATLNGASSLGVFLFEAFAEVDVASDFDYTSTSAARSVCDLNDFNYIYSWICGFAILFALAKTVTLFIDRAISIAILFICSPFSIASSIVDDGARFKLWRDQVLTKFLTGYGTIIGINVYGLVVMLVSRDSVVFFDNSFLNFLMKIAIILGGSFSLSRITAVVGNLVTSGGGTSEVNANEQAAGKLTSLAGAAINPMTYFRAGRGIANFARDSANFGLGSTIAERMGFKTKRYYDKENNLANRNKKGGGGDSPSSGSDNQNNQNPNYQNNNSELNNALSGDNQNNNNNNENNNQNSNGPKNTTGQSLISNAISNDDNAK